MLDMKEIRENDVQDEEIVDEKFGKLILSADLPESVIADMIALKDKEKFSFDDARKTLVDVLSVKNDGENVRAFVASLGTLAVLKVNKFVSAYLKVAFEALAKKETPSGQP